MKQHLCIPEAALRDHVADLGKTGSGKTSRLKSIVEWLALQPQPARVCVLDPIKSDWWGITSSADGKRPGLPFQILGGPHGHVPLRSDQGALVGELVAKGQLPLSIVDMADFEPGGLSRFFNEFAPALLRHMRGVLYLVLEEAHEFAPKERAGIGNENLSVHWAKKLATAGRSKGVRLLVATQRTQALHNAVLGSCETLLAHRLTAPADQKPVQDWLKANTAKDEAREIGSSLAQLKTGTAWVVSAGMSFAEKVTFPRIVTFDNSATPDSDEALAHVKTAPVDRGALAEMLRISAEQIDQTDPKKLRDRIADLERQIADQPLGKLDPNAEGAAEHRGFMRGKIDGYAEAITDIAPLIEGIMDHSGDLFSALTKLQGEGRKVAEWVERAGKKLPQNITENMPTLGLAPVKVEGETVANLRTADPQNTTIPLSVKPGPSRTGKPPVEQRILDALAELESMRVPAAAREIIGFLVGYSNVDSRGFKEAVALLKAGGLIQFSGPGLISLTVAGRNQAVAPPPRSAAQIQERIVTMLGHPTGKILRFLIDIHPQHTTRERLGQEAGYTNIDSKGFKEALAKLKSLSFIDYPRPGSVQATNVLFLKSA